MNNPKYLLLIWDIRIDRMNPYLMTTFESDFEFTEIHKGRLADTIEKVLNIKISTDDFDYEPISFDDFMEEYGNPKNPNRVSLCETHKF